ncbi:DNA repair RAD4 isoform X1 [Olea europaea subsp. europaea]|uniref:DNA repair RAD4 isoform X1 n=1 Tax=Olea europaea subsp. europaea TaxID=158383 RepID=A0A8S0V6Y2_OLEEU|nr:DNA repair RAD4 isoform X1 [Olea europaea subsp. europaea]
MMNITLDRSIKMFVSLRKFKSWQASLLSLLPTDLLKITEIPVLTATCLTPIVRWFHNNFHVRSPSDAEKSCHLALASTLETREGTAEEVAALSVALFRAMNLTTRFVSILDVASMKPDAYKCSSTNSGVSKGGKGIFNSSTLMVAGPSCSFDSPSKLSSFDDMQKGSQSPVRGSGESMAEKSIKHEFQSHGIFVTDKSTDGKSDSFTEAGTAASVPDLMESEGLKRKGDLEFEMQLKIALSATAIESSKSTMAPSVVDSPSNSSTITPPYKRMKKIMTEGSSSSSNGISTSIGSKKVGAPLYWAEVFCNGENLTGKWVHVDAVNAIIDGEQKVEAAASACKKSLRYVVAFAGHGAKDVTRRYCTKWYKIASQRINSTWWDRVLAPLKELESGATSGVINLEQEASVGEEMEALRGADQSGRECLLKTKQLCGESEECSDKVAVSLMKNSVEASRSSLEDMELETRALTEPLPTNQQAYKNHHLYAIERWLKKYEIMYPKGPVLGFCSGHPVYPRTCVQTLHTKERWLREGLQVKVDELPAKVLKRSLNRSKEQAHVDDEYSEVDPEGTVSLYGKWQTKKLCLPQAINGIVPKNERGRVDVWSEKCLPPGTVHLRLPRVGLVAKRLDIDYAPAMVGFEFRNGRSFPVVEGIVVCAEYKDAILEAYAEEEERRMAEEKRRNEALALSRWYQLLSSIITRQRLKNCYGDGDSSQPSIDIPIPNNKSCIPPSRTNQKNVSPRCHQVNTPDEKHNAPATVPTQNHEHEFIMDDQTFDEESSLRVKKCWCGFSIQFEEL